MGGAQSSSSGLSAAEEEGRKKLENELRGSGELAVLERAFSHLTASSSESSLSDAQATIPAHSLQEAFGLTPIFVGDSTHPSLSHVAAHTGDAIVTELFNPQKTKEISWIQLLQGFHNCNQTAGGNGLKLLFSVYSEAIKLPKGTSESKVLKKAPVGSGGKFDVVGYLTGDQLRGFLWLGWLLMCSNRLPRNIRASKLEAFPPNIDSLLSGAISVCDVSKSKDPSSEQSGLEQELSVMEIHQWVLSTIPSLSDCLMQYVRGKMEGIPTSLPKSVDEKNGQNVASESSAVDDPVKIMGSEDTGNEQEEHNLLLHSGVAWAIGLSLRDTTAEILFRASCGLVNSPESEHPNLLYRSSVHGRGMNRFWTCVQGYGGPTLFLVAAETEEVSHGKEFVLGALIYGGFDNKDTFYGASGSCLFALDPVFLPLRSTGGEKHFVYSHKRAKGVAYRAKPKPEGIGFGGSQGKERIWLDEEFGTITLRHHAVDKTFQAGSLFPNQGYAPIVAKPLVIEVWGLGGKHADAEQNRLLKRENLFTEQRRKVDLKTMFGTWENSPEKMMMNMCTDPNAPGREER